MADPITREQVERLIAEAQHASGFALAQAALRILGNGWLTKCPRYVAETFDVRVTLPEAYRAALTGWRDELAAAEPIRKVARWDATRGAYVALDAHGAVCMITPDRETAIGWGYDVDEVEPVQQTTMERARAKLAAMSPEAVQRLWGDLCAIADDPEMVGPEPAEDSPERLRERREALGLSRRGMADLIRHASPVFGVRSGDHWHPEDVRQCEEVPGIPAEERAVYAAALSAEEARRAAEIAKADAELADPKAWRPAEVGDLDPALRETARRMVAALRSGSFVPSGYIALPGAAEWRVSDHSPEADARWADQLDALLGEPTSPPAPEVVDVPQPVVKRCTCPDIHDAVEATWQPGEPYLTVTHTTVPAALILAIADAIRDAQQGGAS